MEEDGAGRTDSKGSKRDRTHRRASKQCTESSKRRKSAQPRITLRKNLIIRIERKTKAFTKSRSSSIFRSNGRILSSLTTKLIKKLLTRIK